MSDPKHSVDSHYDAVAENYHQQYERDGVHDLNREYPANFFRLQLLINSFVTQNLNRIIEVGVGEGTPLCTLGNAGMDIWGFDISDEMVKKAKETVKNNGMNPDQIFWGDVQDSTSYVHALKEGRFDGLMAMGVMPHVENDDLTLKNISTMVRPGGRVFIEFRNKLMSLFSFNRYTADFILDDLLAGVDSKVKDVVAKDLQSRLRMDMPPEQETVGDSDAPGFDAILSKFHNPFEVPALFERHGFTDIKLHWYHYHPAMPYLEKQTPEAFRKESLRLEHDPSDWRGYFLCSAFVVEAVNGK